MIEFDSKTKYLFVGGPKDGEWLVGFGPYVKVLEVDKRFRARLGHVDGETSTYVGHLFVAGEWETLVYVHESCTVTEAFQRLLDKYRPQ